MGQSKRTITTARDNFTLSDLITVQLLLEAWLEERPCLENLTASMRKINKALTVQGEERTCREVQKTFIPTKFIFFFFCHFSCSGSQVAGAYSSCLLVGGLVHPELVFSQSQGWQTETTFSAHNQNYGQFQIYVCPFPPSAKKNGFGLFNFFSPIVGWNFEIKTKVMR